MTDHNERAMSLQGNELDFKIIIQIPFLKCVTHAGPKTYHCHVINFMEVKLLVGVAEVIYKTLTRAFRSFETGERLLRPTLHTSSIIEIMTMKHGRYIVRPKLFLSRSVE